MQVKLTDRVAVEIAMDVRAGFDVAVALADALRMMLTGLDPKRHPHPLHDLEAQRRADAWERRIFEALGGYAPGMGGKAPLAEAIERIEALRGSEEDASTAREALGWVGMALQLPDPEDPEAAKAALQKVLARRDSWRVRAEVAEAALSVGTWCPGTVQLVAKLRDILGAERGEKTTDAAKRVVDEIEDLEGVISDLRETVAVMRADISAALTILGGRSQPLPDRAREVANELLDARESLGEHFRTGESVGEAIRRGRANSTKRDGLLDKRGETLEAIDDALGCPEGRPSVRWAEQVGPIYRKAVDIVAEARAVVGPDGWRLGEDVDILERLRVSVRKEGIDAMAQKHRESAELAMLRNELKAIGDAVGKRDDESTLGAVRRGVGVNSETLAGLRREREATRAAVAEAGFDLAGWEAAAAIEALAEQAKVAQDTLAGVEDALGLDRTRTATRGEVMRALYGIIDTLGEVRIATAPWSQGGDREVLESVEAMRNDLRRAWQIIDDTEVRFREIGDALGGVPDSMSVRDYVVDAVGPLVREAFEVVQEAVAEATEPVGGVEALENARGALRAQWSLLNERADAVAACEEAGEQIRIGHNVDDAIRSLRDKAAQASVELAEARESIKKIRSATGAPVAESALGAVARVVRERNEAQDRADHLGILEEAVAELVRRMSGPASHLSAGLVARRLLGSHVAAWATNIGGMNPASFEALTRALRACEGVGAASPK